LYKIGVESERIIEFKSGDKEGFQGPNFILMEKSKIQSEMKAVFDGLYKENNSKKSSPLFPHVVNTQIIRTLHNQYISAKGYTQNKYKMDGENIDDCVTRILKNFYATQKRANKEPVFEMVVIDEAHQLKNRKAMWAMGVGLMSLHAKRCIPLTGTPYGNRATDLGTLMTFIDPRLRSTRTDFWRNATSLGDVRSITENLTDWKETYLVRRTKDTVLKGILPSISSSSKTVPQHPSELFVQKKYEASMKKILGTLTQNLKDDNFNPFVRNEVDLMLACMASLRSVCIHPLLGGKGREITKLFSPSRNKNLKESNISKCCVHCYQSLRPTIPCDEEARKRNEKDRNRRKKLKLNRLNIDLDGDDIVDEDDEEIIEYGEILMPVPPSLCKRHGMYGGPQHFAHENCLQDLLLANDGCPRCVDLSRRIHIQMENQAPFQSRYYCKFIETIPGEPGGFKGSSKINAVVDHVIQSIPKDDKVLLLSFFKGSLDLLEGIFYHEYGLDCARFDGDLTAEHASAELERFKRSPTCKILLASVQSGGTGLNIVEANHVLFIDRWFNPFVHSQARDRCHRIGQKKEVEVAFFDNSGSVDEVMRLVNKFKAQNAKVVLSDGTDLGDLGGNALNYMELSGLLGRAFDGVIGARERSVAEKGLDALVPPTCESLVDAILANDRKLMTKMMRGEITKK